MNKNISILTLFISFLITTFSNITFAQGNFNYTSQEQNSNNLQGYALYVPAGITLNAVLSTEINSQNAIVGTIINAVLIEDFIYNDSLIASSGSIIQGSVVSNKKAGFGSKNAQMQIRFTTIRTPYNNIIPISATIYTNDSTGILKGATTKDTVKEYAKDTAIGAGSGAVLGTAMGALSSGAVLGTAMGALSSGSVGKGAIYGTALGAGMGIIKNVAQKGENILIPANSQITLFFDQPITLGAQ